jgi:4-hydroxybenzoate polyprenyltransferase
MRTAAGVVAATGAAALALGAAARSPPLMATLAGSLALGVAYSTDLPGLRWKQHPLAAAACILAVRCALESGLGSGLACAGSRIRSQRPHVSWPCGAAAVSGVALK